MYASTKAAGFTNIDLSGERMMKKNLRKYRGNDGMLEIYKLSNLELQQARYVF